MFFLFMKIYDEQRTKRVLMHLRTRYVQICMCIWAVWSGHSLLVDIHYSIHWFCKWTMKAQISLRLCTGWSGPALSANYRRALFWCFTSYVVCTHKKYLGEAFLISTMYPRYILSYCHGENRWYPFYTVYTFKHLSTSNINPCPAE